MDNLKNKVKMIIKNQNIIINEKIFLKIFINRNLNQTQSY